MSYLILDLECDIKSIYGRKSHFRHNDIVSIGTKSPDQGQYKWVYGDKSEEFRGKFKIEQDILVGHNLKYDLLYLWNLKGFQEFLSRKGQIWCTMTAEYYLSGQQSKYAGLRELAVNKAGCQERPKLMEEYWSQGVTTSEIDKSIVLQDLRQDVLDTEQLYLKQIEESQKLNMTGFIQSEMELLLATIEMEFNGFKINQQVLENNKKELEIKKEQVLTDLNTKIRNYWKL